jgi:hypothetical protein
MVNETNGGLGVDFTFIVWSNSALFESTFSEQAHEGEMWAGDEDDEDEDEDEDGFMRTGNVNQPRPHALRPQRDAELRRLGLRVKLLDRLEERPDFGIGQTR